MASKAIANVVPLKIPFSVEQKSRNVHFVHFDIPSAKGWEQYGLIRSDAHHDSKHCDRKMELRHLDEALERKAFICDFGDSMDLMQGKGDKRSSLSELRDEHKRTDYLSAVAETTADDYAKYAHNWVVFGEGNHESAVKGKLGSDVLANMVTLLNYKTGARVYQGGYAGYIKFCFTIAGRRFPSVLLKYHHGWGGGGVVTGPAIPMSRQSGYVYDADIVYVGHYHDRMLRTFSSEHLTQDGKVVLKEQNHIAGPGYKNEYNDGHGGWHIERGAPPKPLGAWWVRFFVRDEQVKYELVPAT